MVAVQADSDRLRVLDPNHPGLCLRRKAGSQFDSEIVIDLGKQLVVIQVDQAERGMARLRIRADRAIPVHRREVFDAIQRERQQVQGEPNGNGSN